MCGIGGILFSGHSSGSLHRKKNLFNDRQQHRGPDQQSGIILGQHLLCHQRLSLLDNAGGQQPFTDPARRYYIVYNGELYNYKELKKELTARYHFVTSCDTEVVLAAWLVWGTDCLDRFDGMFAFLIWDSHTESGFAARDPVGVKPFVYHYKAPAFIFASEIKALLPMLDAAPALNEYALTEFIIAPSLSGGGEASLLKGIHYLEPGSWLSIDRSGLTVHQYYRFRWQQQSLPRHPIPTPRSDPHEADLIASVGRALEHSVDISLRADVPVGIFLSGGLDSSVIGAMAAQHASTPPEAFTISFPDHDQIHFDPATIVNSDDLPFARQIAKEKGLPFQEVQASHASLYHSLQRLAAINDRIPAWEQEFSQHFLSQTAARRLKAVMVGDAADETNYGYFFLLNEKVNHSPLGLLHLFGAAKRETCINPDIRQTLQPIQYLDHHYQALASSSGYTFGRDRQENILAMSTLVHRRWLERLLHNGDIHTMHFGLEARVPFANRTVLEQVCKVHPRLGYKNGVEKYVIRRVAEKWMSPSIAWRKKSSLPRDPRLGQAYQQVLHSLLKDRNEFIDTWLHRPALETLSRQQDITESDRLILFNIICLIFWAEQYGKN